MNSLLRFMRTHRLWITISMLISLGIGVFIGIFDLGDSYIYATFGELLYFKWYIPMPPFDHDIPQTLFGPVYSLLILPILKLPAPGGMILLPAIQMMMVMISSAIVYVLVKKTLSKNLGICAALLLVFFPFTIIYATVIMSEIIAMFLVALYIFGIYLWLTKPHWATTSLMVILASIMVLTRYVFLPIFGISIILWMIDAKKAWDKKKMLGTIGIGLITIWLVYNYNLSGRLGLSTVMGRHLYNNVITSARLAPPSPHPVTQFFYTGFVNRPELLFAPWWSNQNQFNDGVRTQLEIDQMYLRVSLLTMMHHPLEYIQNVLRQFYVIAVTKPVYNDRHTQFLATCPLVQCQVNWNTTLCYPAVFYCPIRKGFSTLITINESWYPYPMNMLFWFAMIGIVMAMRQKKAFWRYVALFFVVQHLFQSATEWVEGRFIIPLYPLYVLLIIFGVTELFRKIFSPKAKHIRHP